MTYVHFFDTVVRRFLLLVQILLVQHQNHSFLVDHHEPKTYIIKIIKQATFLSCFLYTCPPDCPRPNCRPSLNPPSNSHRILRPSTCVPEIIYFHISHYVHSYDHALTTNTSSRFWSSCLPELLILHFLDVQIQ